MNSRLFLLVAGVGLSTYLMRLVPLVLTSRLSGKGELPPRLRSFLAAVGPSFVSVFLVYSILPASGGGVDPLQVALKLAALFPVALIYRKTQNLGLAVLSGLAGYGVLLSLFQAFS